MSSVPGASKRRRTGANRTLVAAPVDKRKAPRLTPRPDGEEWHPQVRRWWASVWASDLAATLLHETDEISVRSLADVLHRRQAANSNAEIVRLSTEARMLQNHLGLSPRAWFQAKVELDRGEQADKRRRRRRNVEIVPTPRDTPMSEVAAELDSMLGS
jgi:hypothetical protein